ncbi:hypothetical protein LCGC14_1067760 [marine sediment metagenome]|uniref:Uncharacterized protein n=1 Tax=marine sediment metagenome TaxID=412755 RepID=A0A0F9N6B8_9ZZZZ
MLIIGVRELEKKITEKRTKIASIKNRLLNVDKFTNIDELLVELIEQTEHSNELLVLSNRILFMMLKAQLGGEIPMIEGIEDIAGSRYRTRVIRVDNVKFSVLNRQERIFTIKEAGVISEIELISANTDSDNKNYKVRLVADDNIIYNDSWDDFESRTNHEADMTAFDDTNNNKYVLLFQDIVFDESCYLEVYESYATFDYINVKYHEKIGFL